MVECDSLLATLSLKVIFFFLPATSLRTTLTWSSAPTGRSTGQISTSTGEASVFISYNPGNVAIFHHHFHHLFDHVDHVAKQHCHFSPYGKIQAELPTSSSSSSRFFRAGKSGSIAIFYHMVKSRQSCHLFYQVVAQAFSKGMQVRQHFHFSPHGRIQAELPSSFLYS